MLYIKRLQWIIWIISYHLSYSHASFIVQAIDQAVRTFDDCRERVIHKDSMWSYKYKYSCMDYCACSSKLHRSLKQLKQNIESMSCTREQVAQLTPFIMQMIHHIHHIHTLDIYQAQFLDNIKSLQQDCDAVQIIFFMQDNTTD